MGQTGGWIEGEGRREGGWMNVWMDSRISEWMEGWID